MEESVYGKRDGHVSGLAIMSKDQRNLFRGTRGHKTGTILGIDMCPRQDMWKPQAGLVKKWLTMKGIDHERHYVEKHCYSVFATCLSCLVPR